MNIISLLIHDALQDLLLLKQLETPVFIHPNYATTPEHLELFEWVQHAPGRNYMTKEEMESIFTEGSITHSVWTVHGRSYR